jgi:8-oxo-dGTP diphosphatase
MMTKQDLCPAVSVIIRDGDRFLLVERVNNPGKGSFAFPGGKVEPGEGLQVAIKRELFEETALILLEAELFAIVDVEDNGKRFLLHVFLAHSFTGIPKAGDDAANFGWYSQEEMSLITVVQSVRDMVARLMLT